MNIFFDCDFTLTGIDGKLRPYVKEVFEMLKQDGHNVYIWSGVRAPWDIYNFFGIGEYISGVYLKPLEDHHQLLEHYRIPVTPDFCVDDNVGPVEAFGGYVVPPYIYIEQPDDYLLRAYEAFKEFAAQKNSNHGGPPTIP
ncbi:MAG: hypothetical protein HYY02_06055 [Chloroflexi bacterium]|nr:hypothetical protein [Chloroflexota bacterium]